MIENILLNNLILKTKKIHDYIHMETDKYYLSIVPVIKVRQTIGLRTYDIENIEDKVKNLYVRKVKYKDGEYLILILEKNITITISLKEDAYLGPEAVIITPKDNGATTVL